MLEMHLESFSFLFFFFFGRIKKQLQCSKKEETTKSHQHEHKAIIHLLKEHNIVAADACTTLLPPIFMTNKYIKYIK